jgi:ABC-type dipeptide/oligopeptide/nickel transport system permease component
MINYIVRRFLISIPVIWGVLTMTFFGFKLLVPGDPVDIMLFGRGTAADRVRLRAELGLNHPVIQQYWDFLKGAIHGDFGNSIYYRDSVFSEIMTRLPNTLELAFTALCIAVVFSLIFGVLSAVHNQSWTGTGITVAAVIGISIPGFWLGTVLALIVGVDLGWLPVAGLGDWHYLVLPALTLAIPEACGLTRLIRSSMVQTLHSEYVRTAKAKGVRKTLILYKHVLRNALLPLVTIFGLNLAALVGGALIIENVFSRPGMGTLIVQAVGNHDYPVIEGTTFFFAVILVAANLLVDITYAIVDPRISYS